MIRVRRTLRPDAACHSADVLTGPERYAEFVKPERLVFRDRDMKWGDVEEIRELLNKLKTRGKNHAHR